MEQITVDIIGGGASALNMKTSGGGCSSISLMSGTVADIGSSRKSQLLVIGGGGGGSSYATTTNSVPAGTSTGGNGGNPGGSAGNDEANAKDPVYNGSLTCSPGKGGTNSAGGGRGSYVGMTASNYTMKTSTIKLVSGAGGGGLYGGGSGSASGYGSNSYVDNTLGNIGDFGIGRSISFSIKFKKCSYGIYF